MNLENIIRRNVSSLISVLIIVRLISIAISISMYKESFQIYIEPLTELPYELAFSLVAYPITWVSTLTGSLLPKISDLRSKYGA